MTATKASVESGILAVSLFIYCGYNLWLMFLRKRVQKLLFGKADCKDFFAAGKLARCIFSASCASDAKDAILAVQQARNAMTASTYLATVSSVLATAGITILLDPSKTQRIQQLAIKDPILRHFPGDPLSIPEVVLLLALGTLYASFLCFGQSVRLYVHWGYYVRCCSSPFNDDTINMDDVKLVVIRAGVAFTFGMRLFYFFIVLIMWSGGVTWMLLSSIVVTGFLFYFDNFDVLSPTASRRIELARETALDRIAKMERGETMKEPSVSVPRATEPAHAA